MSSRTEGFFICYNCYKEKYGAPANITPEAQRAASLIRQVYDASLVGGNLHVAVDDWNLDDATMDFCAGAIKKNIHELAPEEQQVERECLAALRALDVQGRAVALALHDGFLDNPAKGRK